jgi:probable F420-dependent oxidoreductase
MENFAETRAFAQRAEALGFYAVSVNDHFFLDGSVWNPRTPQLECLTTLGALALATRSIRLAPLVVSMSFRNPALLAKMLSTLDHISDGRVIAGVGAGWFRDEYAAYGYPYPSNADRIAQLADGVKLLKAMWTQDAPSYRGRFYNIERAWNFPKPIQQPHPPLLIGGSGRPILKVAGEHADIVNLIPPIRAGVLEVSEWVAFDDDELRRRIRWTREYAQSAGRDPDSIELSGYSRVLIARDQNDLNCLFDQTIAPAGIRSIDEAKRSLRLLIGTPDEIRGETRRRIEQFGFTYFVMQIPSLAMLDLFGSEILPAFA